MPIQLHINGCHGRKTSATGLQAWASECVLEMAVPPVAASAYWTLQSAAAMVATQLGTTLRYIMQQHSMWHMAQVASCLTTCWRRRPPKTLA